MRDEDRWDCDGKMKKNSSHEDCGGEGFGKWVDVVDVVVVVVGRWIS